jgi:hypothetical protein
VLPLGIVDMAERLADGGLMLGDLYKHQRSLPRKR